MVRTSLLRWEGTSPALRRAWNSATSEVAPWWGECGNEAFNTGLDGVARSPEELGGLQGPPTRAGRTVGFPRFKGPPSHHTQRAVHHRGDPRLRPTVSMVALPRVGTITTHESTRKLARRLETGTARILSATVRRDAGRWYCAFTGGSRPPSECSGTHLTRGVGVDLGIKALAVLSTGEPVPNPRHLNRALTAPRTASGTLSRRVGPDRRTGQQPPRPAGKPPGEK